jgi:hypothetical protein
VIHAFNKNKMNVQIFQTRFHNNNNNNNNNSLLCAGATQHRVIKQMYKYNQPKKSHIKEVIKTPKNNTINNVIPCYENMCSETFSKYLGSTVHERD